MLVSLEQEAAPGVAHQAVLVVDEERLCAALSAQAREQGQLRAEDERVVDVDHVEAAQSGHARDERRVADREGGLDAVNVHARRLGHGALRRRGEDLDMVPALGLADREAVSRVAGAAGIGRKRRSQMGYSHG